MKILKDNWGWLVVLGIYVIGWFVARSLYGLETPSGNEINKFDVTMVWVMSPLTVLFMALLLIATVGL